MIVDNCHFADRSEPIKLVLQVAFCSTNAETKNSKHVGGCWVLQSTIGDDFNISKNYPKVQNHVLLARGWAFWGLVNADDTLQENGLAGYDSCSHHCVMGFWSENGLWERHSSLDWVQQQEPDPQQENRHKGRCET